MKKNAKYRWTPWSDTDWKSLGTYNNFRRKYAHPTIEPESDWFVSSVLANYGKHEFSDTIKARLVYFLYLYLNDEFHKFLVRCRELLGIPKDGFDVKGYLRWHDEFEIDAKKYRNGETIGPKFAKVITFLDNNYFNFSPSRTPQSHLGSAVRILISTLVKGMGVNDSYRYWDVFLSSVLFRPDPRRFLHGLHGMSRFEKVGFSFHGNELRIILDADSSINTITNLLTNNKDYIAKGLRNLKKHIRDTAIETDNLDRDYKVYKLYLGHKSTKFKEDSLSNERKEQHVLDRVKLKSRIKRNDEDDDTDLRYDSIRKLVSRMKKRIEATLGDKKYFFNAVLDRLEATNPSFSSKYRRT